MHPYPPTGMVILCWDRALELLPFCSTEAIVPLLRAMVRLSPPPPKRMVDAVTEKLEEIVPKLGAKGLARALYWVYRSSREDVVQLVKVTWFNL